MSDQVVSVRLRRGATSTPWGFRMQGGFEHGTPLTISQVNPKSLSYRLGLRLGDRLLAIGPVQAHHMSHEQAKMEIIRAGNELDLLVQRNPSMVIDQPDSGMMHRSPRVDTVEESTQYRGYTNPNVQSRSFKILQESLNYSEANEEGMLLHTGSTPGEGIVRRAYSEGRRRLEELSEINPRNFTGEGESPYRYSEYNYAQEESSGQNVVAAKVYDGSEPKKRERPAVNIANSSVLSPAGGQQQYLKQAKEHYQSGPGQQQQQQRPAVNIAHSSVLSPAAGQQQYLQQAHDHYEAKSATQQQSMPEPVAQQAVTRRQRPKERQLKLVNYQFDEQYGHLQKDQKPIQVQPQSQNNQGNAQKAAVSRQKSGDFIPATQMVESVAADLSLKIVSPGTEPQQPFRNEQTPKTSGTQVVKPAVDVTKPSQQVTKPPEPVKPVQEIAKPTESLTKPEQTIQSMEQVSKPEEEITKPVESEKTLVEEKGKVDQTQDVSIIESATPTPSTEAAESETNETVNKFAEDLSSSVVASAQQTVQAASESQSITVEQSPVDAVESKEEVVEEKRQDSELVEESNSTPKPDDAPTETVGVVQAQSDESAETVEPVAEQPKSEPEQATAPETIPTAVIDDANKPEDTSASVSVDVTQQSETETKDTAVTETQQEATTGEVINEVEVNAQPEAQPSSGVNETSEVVQIAAVEENEPVPEEQNVTVATSEEQTVSIDTSEESSVTIATDAQSEEHTFSISVEGGNEAVETTSEGAELTFEVSANEAEAAESSASFEIATDAEVTLDVSSDITTDVSTNDVTVESNASANIAVQEEQSAEAEASVTVEENKPEPKKQQKVPEPIQQQNGAESKQNQQNGSKPPAKAKFVDSQGGVAARLARLKQK